MKKHIETLIALAVVFILIAFIESTLDIFEWSKAWKTILAIFTLLGGAKMYDDYTKDRNRKEVQKVKEELDKASEDK